MLILANLIFSLISNSEQYRIITQIRLNEDGMSRSEFFLSSVIQSAILLCLLSCPLSVSPRYVWRYIWDQTRYFQFTFVSHTLSLSLFNLSLIEQTSHLNDNFSFSFLYQFVADQRRCSVVNISTTIVSTSSNNSPKTARLDFEFSHSRISHLSSKRWKWYVFPSAGVWGKLENLSGSSSDKPAN